MWLKDHKVGSKHDSSCLLLVVVNLNCSVTRTTVGNHTRLVPVLLSDKRRRGEEKGGGGKEMKGGTESVRGRGWERGERRMIERKGGRGKKEG